MIENFGEILIVGAGPAGCAASMQLSKQKIPHIIIDKCEFPRDKVCGDALSGKVIDSLKKVDLQYQHFFSNKEQFLPTFGIEFIAPNGKKIQIPFPERNDGIEPGFVARRFDFDNCLVERLDKEFAQTLFGVHIHEIKGQIEKVAIKHGKQLFDLTPKVVIAADGPTSAVRKHLRLPVFESKHHSVALRSYVTGVKNLHPENYLELHFIKESYPGYFWIFPLSKNEANVGLGMLTSKVKAKGINLRQLLKEVISNNKELSARFENAELGDIKGWSLPLGSTWAPKYKNNVLLTGDAAGLVDPFTGEGIGNAMVSGIEAANAAERILQGNSIETASRDYDQILKAKLFDELKLSHRLQKLSGNAWLFNFLINRTISNPGLQKAMTTMFSDLDMREQLKKPSFYLRLLTGQL
ncbi:MAG: geranylgeranyl reductase family protein [Bacteroidetes bacterium]|nr:geranylgeranyl reductase family protein [Bacteroidota bacterium]